MEGAADLSRFEAHQNDFDRALVEIESGGKRSHWMWYVFPQVAGLGITGTSRIYAIATVAEAEAFLLHPALGPAYRRNVDAVWHQVVEAGVTVRALFGTPDDLKLVSSLTLFASVARRLQRPAPEIAAFASQADDVLRIAYEQGFDRCTTTERFMTSMED
jgi:uncharacterized protein (DUF1810 family)